MIYNVLKFGIANITNFNGIFKILSSDEGRYTFPDILCLIDIVSTPRRRLFTKRYNNRHHCFSKMLRVDITSISINMFSLNKNLLLKLNYLVTVKTKIT